MWGLVKMLGVAAAVGAGAGVFAKGKIDAAIKGEAPKKVKRSKVQVIEVPAEMDIKEVNVIVQKDKRDSGDKNE